MENILVVLEKTGTGYSAFSDDVPGCVATGESLDEIKKQINEAIVFHLEGLREFNEDIPDKLKGDYKLEFKIDVSTFFEWASGVLSQTGLARVTGMNKNLISQYANGIKKPGPKQLKRIETALHRFGRELQAMSF